MGKGIYKRNRELAIRARGFIAEALGGRKFYPDHMMGSMFTLSLGALKFDEETENAPSHLRVWKKLEEKYGYGAYALPVNGEYLLRVSCHLYNRSRDYKMLASGIAELVREYG